MEPRDLDLVPDQTEEPDPDGIGDDLWPGEDPAGDELELPDDA